MILQFLFNFFITLFLLQFYLNNINHKILFDKIFLVLEVANKTKTGSGIIFQLFFFNKL